MSPASLLAVEPTGVVTLKVMDLPKMFSFGFPVLVFGQNWGIGQPHIAFCGMLVLLRHFAPTPGIRRSIPVVYGCDSAGFNMIPIFLDRTFWDLKQSMYCDEPPDSQMINMPFFKQPLVITRVSYHFFQ